MIGRPAFQVTGKRPQLASVSIQVDEMVATLYPDSLQYVGRDLLQKLGPMYLKALLEYGRPVMVRADSTLELTPGRPGAAPMIRTYTLYVGEDSVTPHALEEAAGILTRAGYAVAKAGDKAALALLADKMGYHLKKKRRRRV